MMMRQDNRDDADDIGVPSTGATCGELRQVAWSYLDGESPLSERRRIHAHLGGCDHCHAYLQYLRVFLRVLRAELRREPQEPSA